MIVEYNDFWHLWQCINIPLGYELSFMMKTLLVCRMKGVFTWRVSKYKVISGPHFPVYGLNTKIYGPEITPYLDAFHTVVFYMKSDKLKNLDTILLGICIYFIFIRTLQHFLFIRKNIHFLELFILFLQKIYVNNFDEFDFNLNLIEQLRRIAGHENRPMF